MTARAGAGGPAESSCWQRLWNSPLLLFLLSGLYPAVFLLSRNWHMFAPSQIVLLVIATPATATLLGLSAKRFAPALAAMASRSLPGRASAFVDRAGPPVVSALSASAVFIFLMQSTLFYRHDPAWFKVSIVAFAAACVALLSAVTGLAVLNVMLSAMLLLAAAGWVTSFRHAAAPEIYSWVEKGRDISERLVFTDKPNVYLIHVESLHNREALQTIYGTNNREFEAALGRLGFAVIPGQYSNYNHTLASLGAIFGMRHHYYINAVGTDDALGVRDMIGGKTFNPVLQVFRRNGYRCQLVHTTNYAFRAGDAWDFVYPGGKMEDALSLYQSPLLNRVAKRLTTSPAQGEDYRAILDARVGVAAGSASPYFSFLALPGSDHSPVDKRWHELEYWEKEYPRMLRQACAHCVDLVTKIVAGDPRAVILVYGDHGAMRYRKLWGSRAGSLDGQGVTASTLAMDNFGTFLAIRRPGGDPARFRGTTHVNLFRTLFADLSEDRLPPDPTVENDSYFMRDLELYRAVREGQPLAVWEKADEKLPNRR